MTMNPGRTVGTALLISLLTLLLSSCATIFNGTQQLVPFSSQPQGAEVWIDGEFKGTTPVEVNLQLRQKQHEVVLKLGDLEQSVIIERTGISGTGTVGLVIDVLPGGALAVMGIAADLSCGQGHFCGLGTLAAVVGVGFVALPLGLDLATGAPFELEPGEVFVDFEWPLRKSRRPPSHPHDPLFPHIRSVRLGVFPFVRGRDNLALIGGRQMSLIEAPSMGVWVICRPCGSRATRAEQGRASRR
jgi:hypothetical protein